MTNFEDFPLILSRRSTVAPRLAECYLRWCGDLARRRTTCERPFAQKTDGQKENQKRILKAELMSSLDRANFGI
jgi:hypothetical protein